MSDVEETTSKSDVPEDKKASGDTRGKLAGWLSNRYVKIGWWLGRLAVGTLALLVVAHLLGGVWHFGWFQAVVALLLCVGIPIGFHTLVRQQVAKRGGKARFHFLTLFAALNLPVLVWAGIQRPMMILDSVKEEGVGAVKWVAGTANPADEDGEEPSEDGAMTEQVTEAPAPDDAATAEPMAPILEITEQSTPAAVAEVLPAGAAIPYESSAGQLLIQASINGNDPMPFILDTGASNSTLSSAALAALGLAVPPDAPVRTMRTAGGETQGAMLLIDRVGVGEHEREGLVFWLCEPCAVGDAVGLLGLNFWQGYLLTIDPVEQHIKLQPRQTRTHRNVDVEPFLDVTASSSRIEDGALTVEIELHNRATRPVEQAVVLVQALDENDREIGAFTIDAGRVPERGRSTASGQMPQAGEVKQVKLELLDAWW